MKGAARATHMSAPRPAFGNSVTLLYHASVHPPLLSVAFFVCRWLPVHVVGLDLP